MWSHSLAEDLSIPFNVRHLLQACHYIRMQHCPGVPAVWAQVTVWCGPCFYVSLHPKNPAMLFGVVLPPENVVLRDFTYRCRCLAWCRLPKKLLLRGFCAERVIVRDCTTRRRRFYVILPPENACFALFYLLETLVLRDFASRIRLFPVAVPTGIGDFTCFRFPDTFVFTWFHLPENGDFT